MIRGNDFHPPRLDVAELRLVSETNPLSRISWLAIAPQTAMLVAMTALNRKGLVMLGLFLLGGHGPLRAAHWPQFRGPSGRAVAEGQAPPAHFGPASNVLWRIALPPGHSSPCIFGDRVFLTGSDKTKLETLCLDRASGNLLWRQAVAVEKTEPAHRLGSPACSTPATDGERVYIYFGSFGLLAYDFSGRELWRKPLPAPMVEFGTGTSPIVAGDRVILLCDQDMNSYLLAVAAGTGQTLWRVERPEFRRGFTTPFVWRHGGMEELIVPGSIWLRSYQLANGRERWTYSGTSRVACSSPTASDDLLFSASWNIGGDEGERITMPPFAEFAREHDKNHDGKLAAEEIPKGPVRERFTQMDLDKDGLVTPAEWQVMAEMFRQAGNALLAIRPGGQGDVTATHLAWKVTRSLPYVPSPLYYQGRVYTVKSGGLMSCYEAATGQPFFQDERLEAPGEYYASPVAAGGQLHLFSQKGLGLVLAAGNPFKVLARNPLGEEVFATPAIVEGKLYVRTTKALWAFHETKP